MIASTYTEWFSLNGKLAEISLRIESWHSTSQAFLTINGEVQHFTDERIAVAVYKAACESLHSKESWELENDL